MSEESGRYLAEKEKNYQLKLSLKDRCIEDLTDKLTNAEREVKRMAFDKREFEGAMDRKLRLLEEENNLLRLKFEEVMSAFDKSVSESSDVDKYKSVEHRYTQAMDLAKITGNKLEESEFNVEQLRLTVDSLRKEILSLNDLLKATRESNCQLEMQLVDSREKLATNTMQLRSTRSLLAKSDNEVLQALDTVKQLEVALMTEKKRCVEIERLRDEAAFAAHNTERSLSDQLKAMKTKFERLSADFESVQEEATRINDKLRTALGAEVENMNTLAKRLQLVEGDTRNKDAEIYRLKQQLEVANNKINVADGQNNYEQRENLSRAALKLRSQLKNLRDDLLYVRKDIADQMRLQSRAMVNDVGSYARYMLQNGTATSKHAARESRQPSAKKERQSSSKATKTRGYYDESQAKPGIESFDRYGIKLYSLNDESIDRRSAGGRAIDRPDDSQSTPAKLSARAQQLDRTVSKASNKSMSRQRYDLQDIELESQAISKRIAMLKANKY